MVYNMFKVNNKDTVFVNFDCISHLFLDFLLNAGWDEHTENKRKNFHSFQEYLNI